MSQDTSAIDSLLGLNVDASTAEAPPLPKQRKRINNLNESHFTSAKGLPYIRKNTKRIRSRLNHGDDYKNLTNLLNFYQLWGHSIYPKANFKDFLEMTMKIGAKSRYVKDMREKWINEEMFGEDLERVGYLPGGTDGVVDANEGAGEEIMDDARNEEDDDDITVRRRQANVLFVAEDESDDDLYSVPNKSVGGDSQQLERKEGSETKDTEDLQKEAKEKSDFDDFDDDNFDDDLDDLIDKPQLQKQAQKKHNEEQEEEEQDAIMKELQEQSRAGVKSNVEEEDEMEMEMLRELGF